MPTGSTCRDCSPVGVSLTAAQSQTSPWWPHPSLRLGLDRLSPRAPSGMAEWHNSDLQRDPLLGNWISLVLLPLQLTVKGAES